MPLLVDTFNVLHVTGVLPPELAGIDVRGLAELIAASRFGREKVELICDGGTDPPPAAEHHGTVIIRYAGYRSSADALIGAIVRRIANPRAVTVVTADRAVQREARKRRCRVLTSAAFLQLLVDDAAVADRAPRTPSAPSPRPPMTDAVVAGWLDTFGISDDEFDAVADEAAALADELMPVNRDSRTIESANHDASTIIEDESEGIPTQIEDDELIEAESVEQWMDLFGFGEAVFEEIAAELGVELLPPQGERAAPDAISPPAGATEPPVPKPNDKKIARQDLNELPLPREIVDEAESLWSQIQQDGDD